MTSPIVGVYAVLAYSLFIPAPAQEEAPVFVEIPAEGTMPLQMKRKPALKAVRSDDGKIARVSIKADDPTTVVITGGKDGCTKIYLTETTSVARVSKAAIHPASAWSRPAG